MRIQIYAPSILDAGKLAATMNLSLRHWDYAGADERIPEWTWADVGTVMDTHDS